MLVSTTQNFNLIAWLKHRRYLTTGDLSRVTHAVLTLAASQTERRPAKVSHNPVLLFEAKKPILAQERAWSPCVNSLPPAIATLIISAFFLRQSCLLVAMSALDTWAIAILLQFFI